jgi:hypothetical protein
VDEILVRSAEAQVNLDGSVWVDGESYRVAIFAVESGDPTISRTKAIQIAESLQGVNALADGLTRHSSLVTTDTITPCS